MAARRKNEVVDKGGRDPRAHSASRPADGNEELFDCPPTVVDPNAGLRAAAALAAHGFGPKEVPTRESKDVAARLAAHERSMARLSGAAPPDPVLPRKTPRGFDLRVDALEEVSGPTHFSPVEDEVGAHGEPLDRFGEPADRFDIPLSTRPDIAAVPPPPRPRGSRWLLGATVAVALLAAAGYLGLQRGWLPRAITPAALSPSPGR